MMVAPQSPGHRAHNPEESTTMNYTLEQNDDTLKFHIVTTIGGQKFTSDKGYVHEARAQGVLNKLVGTN